MRKRRLFGVLIFAIPAVLAAATLAVSGDGGQRNFTAGMIGYQEVPSVSTTATGEFQARLNDAGDEITYTLTYSDLEGSVTQAHIHLGQRSANGGISVFLCSNLGNGPVGTQACPPSPATISGTFTASSIVGPAAQGLTTGEFEELVRAIRAGVTYANVHSTKFPGGEARGQINDRDQRGENSN